MSHAQLNAVLGQIHQLSVPADANLTDAQLLERFLHQHDQTAFAALVKRHGPLVRRVCWRVLHHVQDAEDAFQATFLVLARKAASIRKRETLASWLHGAAYRTALRAKRDAGRRKYHERESQHIRHSQPLLDAAWRELQAVFDEEIANLPEKYRIVFVLCCLESKSKREAAAQLRLKEGTVSSRLAHSRKFLQRRLTRRGLTLSAVLAAVAVSEKASLAAMPAMQVRTTAKASLAFRGQPAAATTVSSEVTALAEGVSQAMTIAKFKTAAGIVLTVASLIAGAGIAAQRRVAATAAPPVAEQSSSSAKTSKKPALPRNVEKPEGGAVKEEILTLSGRVVDPRGKPVAGADVTLWWHLGYEGYYRMWHPRTVKPLRPRFGAISDADGRFRFTFSPSEIDDAPMNMWEGWWKSTQVVAAAKGYGPGWVLAEDIRKGELTIQLAENNAPVHGRIIDLQGRPVAGARVRVIRLERGGDFIKDFLWQTSWTGLTATAATEKDGKFTLAGLGGGRKALVVLEGSTIAHQFLRIDTRGKAEYGDVVVKPTKPIVGTVRAKDTGKPLAGVVIYGGEAWNSDGFRREVRAISDANGHYRLVGMPKAAPYQLEVYCPESQSYLGAYRKVGDSEGLKPITADFALRRGIPVAFRMIDKETRRPVRGTVQYTPLPSNPHYREAEWSPGLFPNREFDRIHMPDPKGVFRLVVYPGPGIVCAWAKYGRLYLPARPTRSERERYIKGAGILGGFLELSEGYRIFDTDKTDKLLTFDIELDPGRTVTGSLIGPDGQPVKGATACGLTYHPHHAPSHPRPNEQQLLKTETFTAATVDVQTPRTLAFIHKDRELIGHVVLRGDAKTPLVVRLQRWGVLTGRLVDAEGKPLRDLSLHLHYPSLPAPGLGPLEQDFKTERAGRFRIEGLLPDLEYELTVSAGAAKKAPLSAGDRLKGLLAQSGEVKELGDIRVKQSNK